MADDTSEDHVVNPTSAPSEDWQAQLQTAVFGAAAFEAEEIDEAAEEVRLRTKWFGILHPETTVRSCYDALGEATAVELCKRMGSHMCAPGELVMVEGEELAELLILSKGRARTKPNKAHRIQCTEFKVGTFWGELQFLGLQQRRTLTVVAVSYCEVASLDREDVSDILAVNDGLRHRFELYAAMRMEIEQKLQDGTPVNVQTLTKELEDRCEAEQDAKSLDLANDLRSRHFRRQKGASNDDVINEVNKQALTQEVEIKLVNDRCHALEGQMKVCVTMLTRMEQTLMRMESDVSAQ